MRVALDVNVILDVFFARQPFAEPASRTFDLIERKRITGFVCATSVTTVFYIGARIEGASKALEYVRRLLAIVEVMPVARTILVRALESGNKDFEDAVIAAAAHDSKVDVLLTRDPKGFRDAGLKVRSPAGFLTEFEAGG